MSSSNVFENGNIKLPSGLSALVQHTVFQQLPGELHLDLCEGF